MSQFDWINRNYGLALKRGSRVRYTGDCKCGPKLGSVISAKGQYINVRFDGDKRVSGPFHPTWEMKQITGAQS